MLLETAERDQLEDLEQLVDAFFLILWYPLRENISFLMQWAKFFQSITYGLSLPLKEFLTTMLSSLRSLWRKPEAWTCCNPLHRLISISMHCSFDNCMFLGFMYKRENRLTGFPSILMYDIIIAWRPKYQNSGVYIHQCWGNKNGYFWSQCLYGYSSLLHLSSTNDMFTYVGMTQNILHR